jgi:predicted secreted protein
MSDWHTHDCRIGQVFGRECKCGYDRRRAEVAEKRVAELEAALQRIAGRGNSGYVTEAEKIARAALAAIIAKSMIMARRETLAKLDGSSPVL